MVISRATLVAIWKSATFGSVPPITPVAISSSTWSMWPGRAARSARTFSSVASLKRAAAATIGAAVPAATDTGTPSLAPAR